MKIERIYAHDIEYYFADEPDKKLDEIDVEHIKKCLRGNCTQGELCQCDSEKEIEFYGWWNIRK